MAVSREYNVVITRNFSHGKSKTITQSMPYLYRCCRKLIQHCAEDISKEYNLKDTDMIVCKLAENGSVEGKSLVTIKYYNVEFGEDIRILKERSFYESVLSEQYNVKLEPLKNSLTTKIWYLVRILDELDKLKISPSTVAIKYYPKDRDVRIVYS